MQAFRKIFGLLAFSLLLHSTFLFGQATLTAVRIPTSIADAGGTGTVGYPYAVFVRIQNWTAGASAQAYLKVYSGTNNEYMWSATGVWSKTTTYANTNQPVVMIDAGGNWSGWIYAKHNSAVGAALQVRARLIPTTPTVQLTTTAQNATILNMSA